MNTLVIPRRRWMASIALAGLVAGLAASPSSALPRRRSSTRAPVSVCTDRVDRAIPISIRVGGKRATGHYVLPRRRPKALVVFAHGYGHTSHSWIGHMRRAARDHGVIAATMDYRGIKISRDSNGDGLPESRGWNVMAGAQDTIAIARNLESRCKSIRKVTIFGVSMGGNTSGLAVAIAGKKRLKKSDDTPLFDHWFDIEGAVNVIETYAGARLLAPVNGTAANAKADIEAEAGGPFEEKHDAYIERAVVARMDDIAASGIKGVVLVHGLDDGLVPYNQSRELSTLLAAKRIAYDFYTIGRRSPESERETTATGYVGNAVNPDYKSPLAGHASEKSTTHIVMVTAFKRLWELIDKGRGFVPGEYRELPVDGELGGGSPLPSP